MGILSATASAWLRYALGTESMARKQATGGIGGRDGNGVELTDPRYCFGTGTFLSEMMAACEDGSLADQIALAQALDLVCRVKGLFLAWLLLLGLKAHRVR